MPQPLQQPTFGATPTGWITWQASLDTVTATGKPWLQKFRFRTFQLLLSIATAGLFLLVVRGFFVGGPFPWADLANAVFFVAILGLLRWRHEWSVYPGTKSRGDQSAISRQSVGNQITIRRRSTSATIAKVTTLTSQVQ